MDDLKKQALEIIRKRDKGRGVSYAVILKNVQASKKTLNNSLDELIDEQVLEELEGGRFRIIGQAPEPEKVEEPGEKKIEEPEEKGSGEQPFKKFLGTLGLMGSWLVAMLFFLAFIEVLSKGSRAQALALLILAVFWAPPISKHVPFVGKSFWRKFIATFLIIFLLMAITEDASSNAVPLKEIPESALTDSSGTVASTGEKPGSIVKTAS